MAWLTPNQLQQIDENATANSSYINLNKLAEGKEHRFRAFGTPITGWQGWVKENGKARPIRWELKPDELPANLDTFRDSDEPALTFFVASLFWDYTTENFGVMLVTQKSVQQAFGKLEKDEDYGSATEYDVKIIRNVKNDRTTYDVIPAPPKPVAKALQDAYEKLYCDLTALYDGGDPFKDPSKN